MFQRITGGKCNLSLGKTCFSTSESKGCDWSPPLRCLGIGVLRFRYWNNLEQNHMKSCDPLPSKQCLRYRVKINTAKLSFSPQPLRFWRSHLSKTTPLQNSEWLEHQTSCDFVISSWSCIIKHSNTKICLPKHTKTALLTFLIKRCAESVTPCQSHFSGELGSSEKKWPNGPNFSPLQIENYRPWYCWCMKSNVTQVIMFWTMPTRCGLDTATFKKSELLDFLKYLLQTSTMIRISKRHVLDLH